MIPRTTAHHQQHASPQGAVGCAVAHALTPHCSDAQNVSDVLRQRVNSLMPQKEKGSDLSRSLYIRGAEEGTRTLTGFLPLPPQDSVSTNSTTSASGKERIYLWSLRWQEVFCTFLQKIRRALWQNGIGVAQQGIAPGFMGPFQAPWTQHCLIHRANTPISGNRCAKRGGSQTATTANRFHHVHCIQRLAASHPLQVWQRDANPHLPAARWVPNLAARGRVPSRGIL